MSPPDERTSLKSDVATALRGAAMGAADVVPGVSGGTVALVLGIYRRLVTAISHFDIKLLDLLSRRKWQQAAAHVDLRFIAALATGVALGILSLAKLMKYLLAEHPQLTLAVFFGLIAASSVLVARMVSRWNHVTVGLVMLGAGFAFWLTGLVKTEAEVSYGYLFLCGMVAICAMILPGISGAFILVILGMYHHVIDVVSNVARGAITTQDILFVAVFGSGCVLGLVGFSKILRILLSRFEAATMAVLCGFMLGSLRKVWPFQSEEVNRWPSGDEVWLPAALTFAAAALVYLVDAIARRETARQSNDPSPSITHGVSREQPPTPRSQKAIEH